ncbi:hypothetical protein JCM8097_003721 [Rhodosporidiobolus ruineniae]
MAPALAPAFTLTPDQLAAHFHVDTTKGLSSTQVTDNTATYGKNVLPEEPSPPLWRLILDQFQDQLVLILLASAGISLVLAYLEEGDDKATAYVEPIVILPSSSPTHGSASSRRPTPKRPSRCPPFLAFLRSFTHLFSLQALMEYSPDEAKVIRAGQTTKVHAVDLVPGDIVSLAVGDTVPADCRILSITSASFTVDQALLTGESHSVSKITGVVKDEKAIKQD